MTNLRVKITVISPHDLFFNYIFTVKDLEDLEKKMVNSGKEISARIKRKIAVDKMERIRKLSGG